MPSLAATAKRAAYSLLAIALILAGLLAWIRYSITQPVICAPACTGVNLSGRSLQNAQLRATRFIDANLQQSDLRGADLSETDFSGADLTGADLRNTDLRNAYLIGADLTGATLVGADLTGANLSGAHLQQVDLTAVDLTKTSLDGAEFTQANLNGSNLRGANLAGISFTGAEITGADLTGANLTGARLSNTNLRDAQLVRAQLTGAWLNLANLTGVNLQEGDLIGASLIGSQLTSANLSGSSLRGALLVGANLDGADLRAADLTDVRLTVQTHTQRELELDPVLQQLNELQRSELQQPARFNGILYDASSLLPAALLPAASQATPLPAVTADEPTEMDKPETARQIRTSFYIYAIRHLEPDIGRYEVDFSLDFHWHEPLLAQTTLDQVDVAQLWHPVPDLINTRKKITVVNQIYRPSFEPSANLWLHMRLKGEFFSFFDLQHFPLDHHTLTLELESTEYGSDALTFAYLYATTDAPGQEYKLQPGRHVALDAVPPGWQIQQIAARQSLHVLPYDRSTWSRFQIALQLGRQFDLLFWKGPFLLLLIGSLLWGVLWQGKSSLGLQLWMLALLLLTTAATHALMVRTVPRTINPTLLDLYLLFCYALLAFGTVALLGLWGLREPLQKPTLARYLRRVLVVGYPALLAALVGALYWYTTTRS
jgi:uncharacterized protein YjbI with pentapeptide repeats